MKRLLKEVIGWIYIDRHLTPFFDAPSHDLYPIWGIDGFFGVGRYPVSAWAILGHHGRQQSVRSARTDLRSEEATFLSRFVKIGSRSSHKGAPLPPGERGDERDMRKNACSSGFSLLPC
eukprot:scaffold5641_cov86-Skeletonema_marinoi.AAC.1